MTAKVSQRGLDLLKRFEGLRLTAYQDSGGVWTIGYGHTGPDVVRGRIITSTEAEALFEADIRRFERGVENSLARHATQNQFDAMVSLAYNIGIHAFRSSTLLQHFNRGDDEGVVREWTRWNKVGNTELLGLTRRRAHEIDHYRG